MVQFSLQKLNEQITRVQVFLLARLYPTKGNHLIVQIGGLD